MKKKKIVRNNLTIICSGSLMDKILPSDGRDGGFCGGKRKHPSILASFGGGAGGKCGIRYRGQAFRTSDGRFDQDAFSARSNCDGAFRKRQIDAGPLRDRRDGQLTIRDGAVDGAPAP